MLFADDCSAYASSLDIHILTHCPYHSRPDIATPIHVYIGAQTEEVLPATPGVELGYICKFWNFGQWPSFIAEYGNLESLPLSLKPLPAERK